MDLITAIQERRSVNFFEPGREIPEETLKGLLEIANLSPSSFNLQPWKVVVVKDPERKKFLRQCAMNQPKVEEASAVLIIVADPLGVEENLKEVLDSWQKLGYMQPEMRGIYGDMTKNLYGSPESLKRKLFAVKNAALFAINLMLAAKAFGLETHPMDGIDEDCIKRDFGIGEDKIIPMLIAVGYLKAGITLLPRAYRRGISDFVRFD
ncbi:MAG: nitroreductase family protein [Thermodesulfovibrionales bacterium]|jgi:nitroreductase